MPPAGVSPDSVSENAVVLLPELGVATLVPAVGVPEQAAAPVPDTALFTAESKPPPVMATLPL